jgi:peptidoglycan/LPS O-acetylase OafA/YrhL
MARLSYSLYLIHYPLIPVALALSVSRGSSAFWIAYFLVSLLAAGILHVAIERPFLRWKDRLARNPVGEPAIGGRATAT